jgi:hypothetical protein
VRGHRDVTLSVRLPFEVEAADHHDPLLGTTPLDVTSESGIHTLTVPRAGVYGVVELRRSGAEAGGGT